MDLVIFLTFYCFFRKLSVPTCLRFKTYYYNKFTKAISKLEKLQQNLYLQNGSEDIKYLLNFVDISLSILERLKKN